MDTFVRSKSMNNINVTTGSIVSSTLNLNTSLNSMRKEQLLRLLTVNVSTALNMAKLVKFEHNNVLLEVFAEALSIRSGTFKTEKLILLRSPNEKPVMQAAFYETEKNLAPNTFGDGQVYRFVGHLIGTSRRFRILKINSFDMARGEELVQRLKGISDFEMSKMLVVVSQKTD